jgi:4,5-dihydroxyphthalate decarboxylase
MTAAVWIRSLLKQCGANLDTIAWIEGSMESPKPHGKPTTLPPLKSISITSNRSRKSLSQLLEEGEIDATIGADLPPCFHKAAHVKRLFPDFKDAEKSTTKRRGFSLLCTPLL